MTINIQSQQKLTDPTLFNGSSLTLSTFKTLYYLQDMHGYRPTHRYIANRCRVSVSTVKRALNTLCSMGYLNWETIYRESCIYYLSPQVLTKEFRQRLTTLYRYYFAISLSLILSPIIATADNELLEEYKGLNNNVLRHRVTKVPDENYSLLAREHPRFLENGVTATIKNRSRKKMTLKLRLEALATLQKIFPLTAHGMLNIKKYPAVAITYATRFVPQCITKLDPYAYFLAICERYCKENRLDIDRHRYEMERCALGILDTDSNFLNVSRLEEMIREQRESESRGQTYLATKSPRTLKREDRTPLSFSGNRSRYIPDELPSEEEMIQTRREVMAKLNEMHGDVNPFVQMLADKWRANM